MRILVGVKRVIDYAVKVRVAADKKGTVPDAPPPDPCPFPTPTHPPNPHDAQAWSSTT